MGNSPTTWEKVSVPPAAGGEGKLAAAGKEEAQCTEEVEAGQLGRPTAVGREAEEAIGVGQEEHEEPCANHNERAEAGAVAEGHHEWGEDLAQVNAVAQGGGQATLRKQRHDVAEGLGVGQLADPVRQHEQAHREADDQ